MDGRGTVCSCSRPRGVLEGPLVQDDNLGLCYIKLHTLTTTLAKGSCESSRQKTMKTFYAT